MPNQLRDIRKFTDLVRYLETELEWPVEAGSFDDLTFEYQPAELGLKDEDAVKIKKIHQLRPLASGQPWGIFFVEFEKKKLPVVVLRRILSHLVVKKRQSANKADQAVWNPEDLLFISAYGDETSDEREIAFAHFHQESGDLPTLQVLGWDGGNTVLTLNHVAGELREKLHWPANPKDHTAWRTQWSRAFRHRIGHTIRTADSLAEVLAALARGIRDRCTVLMRAESDHGPLTKLFKAFKAALIHNLTEESFADTYAQTITYGLLTAAINRTDMSGGTEATYVKADDLTLMVRVTSPFLKEMLQTFLKVGGRKNGVDFDELGIQDVVELLRGDETDLPEILRNFGDKKPGEDPVIHFYEHFLSAYNKKLKIQRGVFYTPQPVVSYIVRSVHELLQTEFGLEDGLASTVTWGEMLKRYPSLKLPSTSDNSAKPATISPDEPFVQILDPATGTATFLVEVIDVIYRTLTAKWKKQGHLDLEMPKLWNEYVPKHLLPRLHGYELLAAPYAIAHLKLGLKLTETGYRFGSDERARIYLTNALEPKVNQLPQIGFEPLAHEAKAVNEIKWYKRFTVVIGNPPYAGISANMGEYAKQLVDAYRVVDGAALNERKIWLQDDYVKFIRYGQMTLEHTQTGILGYITNHAYLDNPTFCGMRQSLMGTFTRIKVNNLHGNANKKEHSPDGSEDKNVFDIKQGVSIFIALRNKSESEVKHAELWGECETKYAWLEEHSLGNTKFSAISPNSPYYFFIPKNNANLDEYQTYLKLTEIFGVSGVGIVTARDSLTIHHTADEVWNTVTRFSKLRTEQARQEFNLGPDVQSWKVHLAQEDCRESGPEKKYIYPILYRPFDLRQTYYTAKSGGFLCRPVFAVMQHMLDSTNVALLAKRQSKREPFSYFWCAKGLVESCVFESAYANNSIFPMYLIGDGDRQGLFAVEGGKRPNLSPAFLKVISAALKLPQKGAHGLPDGVTPEEIFHYAYGVFHSPGYRSRYAEFLKIKASWSFWDRDWRCYRPGDRTCSCRGCR